MSVLDIVQWVVNFIFLAGLSVCFIRLKRPPKDDPRLSRGLQLLQSKISVLEDLSDRTEVQVSNITKLLEAKIGLVQSKIQEAEAQVHRVEASMQKSKEVASIFQDKIPHDEILERKNTLKYVKAARMAHQGVTIDDIVDKLAIPRAEAEFIAKVNKDELMFDESQLPEWIEEAEVKGDEAEMAMSDIEIVTEDELGSEVWELHEKSFTESVRPTKPLATTAQRTAAAAADFTSAFATPEEDYSSLKKIGEQFREACNDYRAEQDAIELKERERDELKKALDGKASQIFHAATAVKDKMVDSIGEMIHEAATEDEKGPAVPASPQPSMESVAVKSSEEKVKVYPSNYVRNHLSHFNGRGEEVTADKIAKVKFPDVDGVLG